jgi:hypothetical protein
MKSLLIAIAIAALLGIWSSAPRAAVPAPESVSQTAAPAR